MTNIFIHNLDANATEEQLQTLFSPYGNVSNVTIVKDRDTGEVRGFAFLEMPDTAGAQTAIRSLHGTPLNGRPLHINEARDRLDKSTDAASSQRRDHRRHRI